MLKKKKKNLISFKNHPQSQFIYKRLLSIAIYEFIDNHLPISGTNDINLRSFIKIIFKSNVDEILEFILNEKAKPNKYELLILYNQLQAPTFFIQRRVKVASTDFRKLIKYDKEGNVINKKDTQLQTTILSDTTLITCLTYLNTMELSNCDYSEFVEGIKWNWV